MEHTLNFEFFDQMDQEFNHSYESEFGHFSSLNATNTHAIGTPSYVTNAIETPSYVTHAIGSSSNVPLAMGTSSNVPQIGTTMPSHATHSIGSSSNVPIANWSSTFAPHHAPNFHVGESSSSNQRPFEEMPNLGSSLSSPSNNTHGSILIGMLATYAVPPQVNWVVPNELPQMVRLVVTEDDWNTIQVVSMNNVLIGYMESRIAKVLAPLIHLEMINVQAIRKPWTGMITPHHIPFEVYVYSKRNLIETVTLHIRRAGVNFDWENAEQFQSFCAPTMLNFADPPKTVDEVFALMDEEISREGVLDFMEPPRNVITTELLPHQKQGLSWLFSRENTTDLPPFWEEKGGMFVNMITLGKTNSRPGPFRGGIFADDMGMGKTLTLLSLIATDKRGWPSSSSVNNSADREPVIWTGNKFQQTQAKIRKIRGYSPIEGSSSGCSRPRPTLVVCPATVLSAWVKQLEDHVRRGSLRAYMYHGDRTNDVNEIKNYDIVFTTYCTVASEAKSEESPLEAIEWWRIILDEAHEIRNPKSKKFRAVTKLNASRRWVVSGTPIQNDTTDIYSMLSFLRVEPFSTRYWFNKCIDLHMSVGDICGISRLQVIIASISLRRMKNNFLNDLPRKSVEIYYVDLLDEEREVYLKVEAEAKEYLRTYYSRFGEYTGSNILSLLMRLRQSCVDITLCPLSRGLKDVSSRPKLVSRIREMMEENEELEFEDCPICFSVPSEKTFTICAHMFCRACIIRSLRQSNPSCPLCRLPLEETDIYSVVPKALSTAPSSSSSFSKGSKAMELLKFLTASKEQDPTIKSVVFSQFKRYLILLEGTLKAAGFNVVRIDGSILVKKRGKIIDEFGKPDGPTVLLASLKSACEGVDLSAASRVYLMEPWWNPAVEEQAMDRIHRIGQTKEVNIIRMVARDTIECRVLKLQDKKKLLASKAFGRRGTQEQREVTSADMLALINL